MKTIDAHRISDIAIEFATYVYSNEFTDKDKKEYRENPFSLYDYIDDGVQDILDNLVGMEVLDSLEIPMLYEDDEELLCLMFNEADKYLEADFEELENE